MPADFMSSAVILSCSDRKSDVEPSTFADPLISPVATSTKRAVTRTWEAAFWYAPATIMVAPSSVPTLPPI